MQNPYVTVSGIDYRSKPCPKCGRNYGESCLDSRTHLPILAPHLERVELVHSDKQMRFKEIASW